MPEYLVWRTGWWIFSLDIVWWIFCVIPELPAPAGADWEEGNLYNLTHSLAYSPLYRNRDRSKTAASPARTYPTKNE